MQEYWEIYMKPIDGRPASVLFNAGISMEMEELKFSHPIVAFVKARLKEPNERGLLNQSEEAEIFYLEDRLEASSIKFRIGKYVGRIISEGSVTFIYYLQYTYNWGEFLAYALSDHKHYEITSGYQEDREWNFYQNLLYPTPRQWQIIQNHKVCDRLKEQGDDLTVKRIVEHTLYFQDPSKKEALLVALEQEGFEVMERIENEDGLEGIRFFRIDAPDYYAIDEITLHLIDLSERYGALYDGWQTDFMGEG